MLGEKVLVSCLRQTVFCIQGEGYVNMSSSFRNHISSWKKYIMLPEYSWPHTLLILWLRCDIRCRKCNGSWQICYFPEWLEFFQRLSLPHWMPIHPSIETDRYGKLSQCSPHFQIGWCSLAQPRSGSHLLNRKTKWEALNWQSVLAIKLIWSQWTYRLIWPSETSVLCWWRVGCLLGYSNKAELRYHSCRTQGIGSQSRQCASLHVHMLDNSLKGNEILILWNSLMLGCTLSETFWLGGWSCQTRYSFENLQAVRLSGVTEWC